MTTRTANGSTAGVELSTKGNGSARREEVRARIVQTVSDLHREGGLDAVTVRGVAQRAGLPVMSLYRYFPGRNDLIRTLWGDVLERAFRRACRARGGTTPMGRLRCFLSAYIDHWLANEDDYWLVFCLRDPPGLEGLAKEAATAFLCHLELLVDRCTPNCTDEASRQRVFEMLRVHVTGLLHTCIALPYHQASARNQLRDVVLDDIEAHLADCWSSAALPQRRRTHPGNHVGTRPPADKITSNSTGRAGLPKK